jgi:hypothetical protein
MAHTWFETFELMTNDDDVVELLQSSPQQTCIIRQSGLDPTKLFFGVHNTDDSIFTVLITFDNNGHILIHNPDGSVIGTERTLRLFCKDHGVTHIITRHLVGPEEIFDMLRPIEFLFGRPCEVLGVCTDGIVGTEDTVNSFGKLNTDVNPTQFIVYRYPTIVYSVC